jgi:hypothetical protein
MEYLAFERRILRLLFGSNAPLTPIHIAYYLDLPVAEARAHLDSMVSNGILELDSDEAGHLQYHCPQRPDTSALPAPRPLRRRRRRKGARARQREARARRDELMPLAPLSSTPLVDPSSTTGASPLRPPPP